MTVIELRAVELAPAHSLDAVLAAIGWVLLSSNEERLIIAPARDLFQFAEGTPTAVGIYSNRVDSYYNGLKVSLESEASVSLGKQLAMWLSDYLRTERMAMPQRVAA